ncbi:hypothetical protein GALMADRAFT_155301 [Galerina marginata CBS 339.88]|uniref:Uncharacterized protein n=1 Tax=Galerina marginata (strain CBS 339.88) TaxID=685588 RepID=A0A067TEN4_GALM3|nr:hypothetical protein GALMADRAFT_155301 [Galerina marginata CBS 339.88]
MLALNLLACFLIPLAAAKPLSSVPIETRSMTEIYHAALRENGTVRVAWGGDVQASRQGIIRSFNKRFPGIKLDLTIDLSKYLDGNINMQHQIANGHQEAADVAVLQSLHDFPRWKAQGRLLHYKVAQWNDIHPQFVDEDGAHTGTFIFTFGSAVYNKKDYPDASSVPTTYPEFLKPQFTGKIALTYPNDDDAILYLFTLITQKYGWSFIKSLVKQKVKWVRGTATPSILCANNATSNPLSISFASSSAFARGVASKPSRDIYMAWPQTGAIFANTKVPEASKLFMNYLLSDEWQKAVGGSGFATRKSFDRAGVFRQKNVEPLGYGKFMADRAEVERWRLQFESILGLPQGANPLTLKL